MPLKPDGDCHDLQARTGRRAKLAPSRRPQPVAKGGHRDKVHRRHPRRQPTATSRLTPPSPRFGYSSHRRAPGRGGHRQDYDRAHDDLDLWPERLIADTGYGSAETLKWLVKD